MSERWNVSGVCRGMLPLLVTVVGGGALALGFLIASPARGQVELPARGGTVVIAFDGYDGSGFAPAPATGQLDSDDVRVRGLSDSDMSFGDVATAGDFARGTSMGGVNQGGVYAFSTDGSTSRAIGLQATSSDMTPGDLTLRFVNRGLHTVTELSVALDVLVYDDETRSSSVVLEHSIDDDQYTLSTAAVMTPIGADPSPSWGRLPQAFAIRGLTIPVGGHVFLRVTIDDAAGTGSRDEIAIDDVTVTVTETGPPCTGPGMCNDGVPCTTDSCVSGRCRNALAAAGESCANENPCDGDERCDGLGACLPGTQRPAGSACGDDNPCNGDETCNGAGLCLGGTTLDCDDGEVCTIDRCDSTGGCMHDPVEAGTSCTDGDACNGAETCDDSGSCEAARALECDDDNACTGDRCDPAVGCVHDAIERCCEGDRDCDDGDPCTREVCMGGTCAVSNVSMCTDAGASLDASSPDASRPGRDSGVRDANVSIDARLSDDAMVAGEAGRAAPSARAGGCAVTSATAQSRGARWGLAMVFLVLLGRVRARQG